MCYYFWGIRGCGSSRLSTLFPGNAWAEWIDKQGVGE